MTKIGSRCYPARMRWFVVMMLCFGLASCEADEESTPGPTALQTNEGGDTVLVDDAWKACETVDDCVEVSTSCDGCCGVEAVNVSLQDDYAASRDSLCSDYDGGVCDCIGPDVTLMCIDQLCTLVEN